MRAGFEKFHEQLRQERRGAMQAAAIFARVCAEGRADDLRTATQYLHEQIGGWRLAMLKVSRLPSVSSEIKLVFVDIWVETKMLPLVVGNRRILADALRILMPCNYAKAPLALYRGACSRERRGPGFSWTTDINVARRFAERWAQPIPGAGPKIGGIILKTTAPADAIMLVREPCDYYDEGEVVIDPFRLGRIEIVERLSVEHH